MTVSPKRTFRDPRANDTTRRRSARAGFSLIEVLIAGTILVIAIGAALSAVTSTASLSSANRESAIVYQAARGAMERIKVSDFQEVIELYNDVDADDPDGAGTAPGPHFAVDGVALQDGDGDGFAGRVLLPLAADGTLREDLDDPWFGMPRDLNGDGVIDADDHSDDAIVLPVRVRVEWNGASGDRQAEYSTLLMVL